MSGCPYRDLPSTSYWRRSVSGKSSSDMDLVVGPQFTITPTDRVATAGSCFAQNIARYLSSSGYNFFVTESLPATFPASMQKEYGYGTFSARFGNVYTARQLVQLFDRAFGQFEPLDTHWEQDGRFLDPFRPSVEPDGYPSLNHLLHDRATHLAAVRRMFIECDVFVYTLGLTEAWMDRRDGAVFPVCPGCTYGTHDPDRHVFHNFDYAETLADMQLFLGKLREVNPAVRVLLTVSPVPLIATAEAQHVAVATTYSKSVLRAVAGALCKEPNVHYFPSFEMISGHWTAGAHFGPDGRDITEAGVREVMTIFFRRLCATELPGAAAAIAQLPAPTKSQDVNLADVACDEEALLG